jgi:hypothetical protein
MSLNNSAFISTSRYEHIALKSHQSFTTGSNSVTVTITHNLGYVPYNKLYLQFPGDSNYYPIFSGGALAYDNWQVVNYTATTTSIIFTTTSPSASQTATVYYRIYAEPQ